MVVNVSEEAPASQEVSVYNILDGSPVADTPVSSFPDLVIYYHYDIGTEGKWAGPLHPWERHALAVCSQGSQLFPELTACVFIWLLEAVLTT